MQMDRKQYILLVHNPNLIYFLLFLRFFFFFIILSFFLFFSTSSHRTVFSGTERDTHAFADATVFIYVSFLFLCIINQIFYLQPLSLVVVFFVPGPYIPRLRFQTSSWLAIKYQILNTVSVALTYRLDDKQIKLLNIILDILANINLIEGPCFTLHTFIPSRSIKIFS